MKKAGLAVFLTILVFASQGSIVGVLSQEPALKISNLRVEEAERHYVYLIFNHEISGAPTMVKIRIIWRGPMRSWVYEEPYELLPGKEAKILLGPFRPPMTGGALRGEVEVVIDKDGLKSNALITTIYVN